MKSLYQLKYGGAKQSGFAVLLISAVLLTAASMLSFLLSGSVVSQQRGVANDFRISQALSAAQAGVEYGTVYLDDNYDTITDGQTVSGTLSNGSTYAVTFTFQGSKDLIKVVATGASSDNTATRVISQTVSYVTEVGAGGVMVNQPLASRGAVEMNTNSIITNESNDSTINSGGSVTIDGNAITVLAAGTSSSSSSIEADITQNDSAAANKTDVELQNEILGGLISSFTMTADVTYNNSSDYDYSAEVNGVEGQNIQLNQSGSTATIKNNVTIGSASNPVTIYVDGNLELNTNVVIYGNIHATGNIVINSNVQVYGNISGEGDIQMNSNDAVHGNVFVTGEVELNSNSTVYGLLFSLSTNGITMNSNSVVEGGVVSGGPIVLNSNARITYDIDNVTSSTAGSTTTGNYAKVPGSWNDLGI